jgi:SAM-dependent methyltransferase
MRIAMGTAQVQGELWGARANDWVEANEPAWLPVYQSVLDHVHLRPGMKVLDVGCGAGGALLVARGRGAEVFGLDASENLAAIARERLPGATIRVGEMEELPFDDAAFDVVMGVNSFQFAGDIVRAFREAGRVCKRGGTTAILVWGRKSECDLLSTVLPGVFALLPPPPPLAGTSLPALTEPGVIQDLLREAGMSPAEAIDINSPLNFPDRATAIRGIMSAMARAIHHSGEDAVRRRIDDGLALVTGSDGPIALRSRFRLVTAKPD